MTTHSAMIKALLNRPLSMSDLQAATQVSMPTLRKAVNELTEARWIRVVGQAEANGGRPAMLFGLDDSFFLMVGVQLQLPGVRLITADLNGAVLDVEEDFTNIVPEPDAVIQRVAAYVSRVQAAYPERQLLGVGIASPGFTDPATGDIISIGRVTGWQNLPICQRLASALDLPVYIANDVDCMAFAEFQHTGVTFEQNLAYVGFEQGVKVSMFLNGQLYKGSFGNAGLIVTDLLNLDIPLSAMERRRILTIEGLNRLFEDTITSLDAEQRQIYADILDTSLPREQFQQTLEGAAAGLPVCQQVVQVLNTALSAALANVIYMVQPDIMVIGGLLSTMPASQFVALEAAIRRHLPALFTNRSVIQQAMLSSPNRAALGANYHFLQTHLKAVPEVLVS